MKRCGIFKTKSEELRTKSCGSLREVINQHGQQVAHPTLVCLLCLRLFYGQGEF